MHVQLDEQEQAHVYSCLLVGGESFSKVKKTLAKLNREDDSIDEEIEVNAKLRRLFNPKAEEEARAASRKNDPAQMDIEEVPSSGETGGGIPAGQTFTLNTGEPMDIAELRDALLECGVAVLVIDIDSWSDDERQAAEGYVNAVRAEIAEGRATEMSLIPEPDCIERDGTTVERLQELLAAGPWRVEQVDRSDEGLGIEFDICRDGVVDGRQGTIVDDISDDKLDAEIQAARLNRTELQRADMTDEDIRAWANKGPWLPIVTQQDGWSVVAGAQKEPCESSADAWGRAARYNRSIAHRAENEHVAAEQAAEAVSAAERAD